MSRDPRVTPVPGDVLSSGQRTFYVTAVAGSEVFYTEDQPPVPVLSVPLDEWRLFAKTDEVVTWGEALS